MRRLSLLDRNPSLFPAVSFTWWSTHEFVLWRARVKQIFGRDFASSHTFKLGTHVRKIAIYSRISKKNRPSVHLKVRAVARTTNRTTERLCGIIDIYIYYEKIQRVVSPLNSPAGCVGWTSGKSHKSKLFKFARWALSSFALDDDDDNDSPLAEVMARRSIIFAEKSGKLFAS